MEPSCLLSKDTLHSDLKGPLVILRNMERWFGQEAALWRMVQYLDGKAIHWVGCGITQREVGKCLKYFDVLLNCDLYIFLSLSVHLFS